MKELIYSKEFPDDDEPDDLDVTSEEFINVFNETSERVIKELIYVPIPGREETAKIFFLKAVELSNRYKYDIKVYTAFGGMEVYLSFDHQLTYTDFPYLIGMADDISFYSGTFGREFTILLTFYTCEIYRNGKRVLPEPENDAENPEL